jgi:hypothetical protein
MRLDRATKAAIHYISIELHWSVEAKASDDVRPFVCSANRFALLFYAMPRSDLRMTTVLELILGDYHSLAA